MFYLFCEFQNHSCSFPMNMSNFMFRRHFRVLHVSICLIVTLNLFNPSSWLPRLDRGCLRPLRLQCRASGSIPFSLPLLREFLFLHTHCCLNINKYSLYLGSTAFSVKVGLYNWDTVVNFQFSISFC